MTHFLSPVLALIVWTLIMWVWMYWRRIPAMNKITRDTQKFIDDPKLWEKMPAKATWPADNYNHLHEQPVLFYALMFYLSMMGQGDYIAHYLAWGYVGIRIIHSFVQVTSNKVLVRFSLFTVGTLILMILAGRAVLALF